MGMEPVSMSNVYLGNSAGSVVDICRIKPEATKDDIHLETQDDSDISKCNYEAIQQFSRHCHSFYNSSLIITNSSTSLDKNVGYAMSNDYKVSHGKIVMEALDRIGIIRSVAESCWAPNPSEVKNTARESLAKLRQEHLLASECHRDLLDDCGLFNVDKFISHDCFWDNNNESSVSYEQYTQIRDAIRRKSHKLAMAQRQSSLYQLLSENEQDTKSKSLTQLKHVKQANSTIEQFVRKYRRNIGSHSFLAGLHRLIHKQLHPKSNSDIVQWNFRGSVLTEACHSNDDGDTEAYIRDATAVLFSILIWIRSYDVEGGHGSTIEEHDNSCEENHEPMLSFQINKFISNPNLHRILTLLPNPKKLDARATGSLDIYDQKSAIDIKNVQTRKNIDGRLDEAWVWWQLCNLL